jgi:hypothetical protein
VINAALLHKAISAVAPVVGVGIGDLDDRSTWRIDFAPEATTEQRVAGDAALAAFDPIADERAAVSVTPWQAREALRRAGLLGTVDAAVTALGATSEAYVAWHYADRIRRASPLIEALAPSLGLSDAQLDALFETAKGLTP